MYTMRDTLVSCIIAEEQDSNHADNHLLLKAS
jgi:hypothetical protein